MLVRPGMVVLDGVMGRDTVSARRPGDICRLNVRLIWHSARPKLEAGPWIFQSLERYRRTRFDRMADA